MKKLLVLSAVTMLAALATGCNCCDLGSCFRRPVTAAMPVCPPIAAPAATIVDPGCAQPVYSAPSLTPGAIITNP
jgi:hypothetical protein